MTRKVLAWSNREGDTVGGIEVDRRLPEAVMQDLTEEYLDRCGPRDAL